MSSKRLLTFVMLIALALVAAACSPAEETGGESADILARVLERGNVVCGGRTDLTGFGYLDENGRNVGFDIDLCRAVAAALFNDPEAVEIVPITAADRGPSIQNAEVDLLTRNVTWTSSRDAQWGNFTIITFYDGQGFMVPADSGIETLDDLEGARVCVTSGTTTETNLATFYSSRGWELIDPFVSEETATVYSTYESGACDATTSDMSQLAAIRSGFANPDDHVILAETISKEPLTAAVPHGDDAWFDVVKMVLFGLINAEEYGVTQANVEQMKSSGDPRIANLLGAGADWGYSDLGLEADAIANAIAAVGNYGEVYDRYLGPDGIAFTLPRNLNELWINGGLIYAPDLK
jgi:general L-amino acid transport system substrate-binding protein